MTSRSFLDIVARSGLAKVLGTACVFGLSMTLARTLGSAEYGVYIFAFSLLSFLVLACKLGFPDLTVRETSRLRKFGRVGFLAAFLSFQRRAILVVSSAILIFTFLCLFAFFRGYYSEWLVFAIGLPLPFIFSLIAYNQAILRGSGEIVRGQLAHQLIRPAVLLAFVILAIASDTNLSALMVMGLHVAASIIVYVWTVLDTRKFIPNSPPHPVSNARKQKWSTSAAVFAGVSVARVINTKFDVIALGILMSYASVGTYAVAAQLATAAAAMTFVTSSVAMPSLSSLSPTRDRAELETLCVRSSQISLVSVGLIWLIAVFFGGKILAFLFGAEYASASTALVILLSGQVVSAFFGPVGDLVNMRGYEKTTLGVTIVASIINVALNVALIPLLGIAGAAWATMIALSFWNITLWRIAWSRIGINSSAIPLKAAARGTQLTNQNAGGLK